MDTGVVLCAHVFRFQLQGGPFKTTVTGVEMFKKILDHGQVCVRFGETSFSKVFNLIFPSLTGIILFGAGW